MTITFNILNNNSTDNTSTPNTTETTPSTTNTLHNITQNNQNESNFNRHQIWNQLVKLNMAVIFGRENIILFGDQYESLCKWWITDSPLGFEILPTSPIALMLILKGDYVMQNDIRTILENWKNRNHYASYEDNTTRCRCIACRRIEFFESCRLTSKEAMICAFYCDLYNISIQSVTTAWDSMFILADMITYLNNNNNDTIAFRNRIRYLLNEYTNNI
jgi:hypothetical protein